MSSIIVAAQHFDWVPPSTSLKLELYGQGYDDWRDLSGFGGVYVQGNIGREAESDYWGVEPYDDFGADYRPISEDIQRGRETASTRPTRYYRQLQQIRSRADWQQRSGRFDSEEIDMCLTQLRQNMHAGREDGRDRDRGNYRD
jgi:hypothetical protein